MTADPFRKKYNRSAILESTITARPFIHNYGENILSALRATRVLDVPKLELSQGSNLNLRLV